MKDIAGLLNAAVTAAKARAKKYGIRWELSHGQIASMAARADGRCEQTGRPFETIPGLKTRVQPWHPSLDRASNDRGYTADNTRLVCTIINLAKSDFPQEILDEMVQWGYTAKGGLPIPLQKKAADESQWRQVTEDSIRELSRRLRDMESRVNELSRGLDDIDITKGKKSNQHHTLQPVAKAKLDLPESSIAILRRSTVVSVTGLSASTIRRLESVGEFPRRVQLGARSIGWKNGEIRAWLGERAKA